MKVSGFGNNIIIDSDIKRPKSLEELRKIIKESNKILAFGNNKSYGDSSLNETSIDMKELNKVTHFNKKTGVLEAESGIMLKSILEEFVPKGYFLYVTPGTKNITLGGAIASNIHGKNHHNYGSFIECVEEIRIINANGEIIKCSRKENKDLFKAVFGSMGLLGVIYSAKLKLRKIKSSYIDSEFVKCSNLDDVVDKMKNFDKEYEYSVAWIDTTAKGSSLGKGVLILGNHSKTGDLSVHKREKLKVPFFMPNFLLNKHTIKIFNNLYHLTRPNGKKHIHYEEFFYPLDGVEDWNKVYGKRGFIQYQFVIPKKNAGKGIREVLNKISEYGTGSFLSVLKESRKEDNLISFPKAGYTLAIDIPMSDNTKEMVEELNKIVIRYNGRIYLTKDSYTSKADFTKMYGENIKKFKEIKKKYDKSGKFVSVQARRVGLI